MTTKVLVHGCWDILHPGHLEHLEDAKAMGDYLVVSVTSDRFIAKGPGRPLLSQADRVRMLSALKPVDEVVISDSPSAVGVIESIKPAFYVKGPDYALGHDGAGNLQAEEEAIKSVGGQLVYTHGRTMSSTALINAAMPRVSPEAQRFLADFRQRHSAQEILGYLEKAKVLSAGVVGESILDKYVWVEPRGKSTKESIVTFRELGQESYIGGAGIIAKHLESVCGVVTRCAQGVSITKTRYVEKPFMRKIFSCVDRDEISGAQFLPGAIEESDFLVVGDFGHGLIRSHMAARQIRATAKWLALTVQSNSLNWGYNLSTKWAEADYMVLDEQEIRLSSGNRNTTVRQLMDAEKKRMGLKTLAVTQGHLGCTVLDGNGFVELPPFADKVVDRMGAGDAFLAITAPLVYLGAPADVVGFVGNIAGAIEVGEIGNVPIDARKLRQWLEALLK